jgi:hypothetical protein
MLASLESTKEVKLRASSHLVVGASRSDWVPFNRLPNYFDFGKRKRELM